MSVKSTRLMTRDEIIEYIREQEAKLKDYNCYTDEELEDMAESLDEALGDKFTNYTIVSEERVAEARKYGW